MKKNEIKRARNKITLGTLENDMRNIMELVENPDIEESDLLPKINAIKKNYLFYVKEEILRETLTERKLDKLSRIFIGDNYKDKKIFEPLNEIAEMVANQYLDFIEKNNLDEETTLRIRKKAFKIHAKVLGNKGTHSEKYSAKYLEEVIREKVANTNSPLDSSEILKILYDKINLQVYDDEASKLLLENAIIKPILAYKKKGNLNEFKNPEILEVLYSYAQVYRYENDFDSYEKYLRLGLEFEQFKEKVQYREINEALERIPELRKAYEERINQLNQNKEEVLKIGKNEEAKEELVEINLDNPAKGDGTEEELDKFIHDLSIYPGFSKLFEDDELLPERQPGNGGVKEHNILSNREKIKNILLMLNKLKSNSKFKDAQISKCYVKKDIFEKIESESDEEKLKSFDEYIIFPIEGLDKEIFVLECFDPIKEGSLYITNKQFLTPIISMKRSIVKKFRNPKIVDFVDHKSTGYVDDLTDAVIGVYEEKNTRNRKVRPETDFIDYLASRMRRSGNSSSPNNGSSDTTGKNTSNKTATKNVTIRDGNQIKEIVSSLGSLSLDELKDLLNKLKSETDILTEQNKNNERLIMRRIIKIIVVRLKLYEKQVERSEELKTILQEIEKEEKDLMSIFSE